MTPRSRSLAGRADADRLIAACRRTFLRGMLFAGLLSGFINLLQLTVPLFMLQVHDRVLNSRSIDTLKMLVVLCLGALVLYGILEYVRSMTFQAIAGRLVSRLNLPAIEASLAGALERGSARGTETLGDLNELRGFIMSNAFGAPLEALWSPIFLTVMFLMHPLYGLVGIIALVIMIGLSLLSDLLCRQTLKEASETRIESISGIGSTIRHAETIEAMGMLPALVRRWRALHFHSIDLLGQGNRRGRAMHAVTRSLRYSMQILVLAVGAYLIIGGTASPGSMIAGTIILGRLLMPFDNITGDCRQWVSALAAWRRVRDVLEETRPLRETFATPRSEGDLVVDRVIYAPRGSDVPILKGVSFSLSPGEVLGIAGPSASGKSTLARILVGAVRPTAGGVYLNGHNAYLWQRESFGDMVGYLPQSVSLLDGTVRENIARMRDADPRLVIEAARAANVHEAVGRLPLGYDTLVGDGRFSLSGGQKQRIALARALFGRPRLLVLDEPNSNLDAEGEQALLRAVAAARADNAIVIVIAHRQSIMQAVDKLLILQDGRVTQFGERTPDMTVIPRGKPVVRAAGLAGARAGPA